MQEPNFNEPVQLGEGSLPSGRKAFAWLETDGNVSLGWEEPGPVDQDLSEADMDYFLSVVYHEAQSRARTYPKGAC